MAHGTQSDLPVIADLSEFDYQSGTFLEKLVFNNRSVVLILCILTTLVLGYQATKIQLQAGDLVVFYTDGVVEAENPQGEQFEQTRLEELLLSNTFLTADDIRSLILDEISNWVRGHEQSDDITVVTLKVEAG